MWKRKLEISGRGNQPYIGYGIENIFIISIILKVCEKVFFAVLNHLWQSRHPWQPQQHYRTFWMVNQERQDGSRFLSVTQTSDSREHLPTTTTTLFETYTINQYITWYHYHHCFHHHHHNRRYYCHHIIIITITIIIIIIITIITSLLSRPLSSHYNHRHYYHHHMHRYHHITNTIIIIIS